MFDDLLATLAWVRELVTMIHLAKFSGSPASRAEELVSQIATAVEGLREVSNWGDAEAILSEVDADEASRTGLGAASGRVATRRNDAGLRRVGGRRHGRFRYRPDRGEVGPDVGVIRGSGDCQIDVGQLEIADADGGRRL